MCVIHECKFLYKEVLSYAVASAGRALGGAPH